jgi:TRAP-type mannitol/chloroaromatic compound transport system permease large subunit
MSDPALGLTMLGLIVVAIMMGFPTAFTLMGLGMVFGFLAFLEPAAHWWDNRIFDLMVQRTYGVMVNDTLLSVPLFVFMGYIMERAALVDRMFHSVQLAFRRVPASLAVTTLLVCAFWGIASGIVGAVVVLMGVIALRPMLNAGYDVRLASGAITAGGTLGILIPPSVMLIVYAAVAGQSIVKLYAAAMLPGFFLTFLYLVYILGWAVMNPKIAPQLPPDQYRVKVPEWLQWLGSGKNVAVPLLAALVRPALLRGAPARDGQTLSYGFIVKNVLVLLVPLALTVGTFMTAWWYVTVYNAPGAVAVDAPKADSVAASDPTSVIRRCRVAQRKRALALPLPRNWEFKRKSPKSLAARKLRSRPVNRLRRPMGRRRKWAPSVSPVLRLRREKFPNIFMPGSGDLPHARRCYWRFTIGAWTANVF